MPITTRCTCGQSIDGRCHSDIEGCKQLFHHKIDNHYNDQIESMEEKKYPIGGFAPGNYQCNCCKCGTFFIGDKRAVECEPCAVAAREKFDALSPEEQVEVIKRNVEAVNEVFKDWGKKPDVNLAIIGHGKPEINHDRVIANQVAGMPLEEAIFQDGYSAGVEFEKKRAQPSAVWVKGAPKENKQYFAKVPSVIEDDTVYNAVIWPIEDSEHWWCVGYGFKFSIHREKIIAHIDESGTAAVVTPTFWDVAKAFKWAAEYGNEQGEQLVLTEDGQWLLLKDEDGVTETDEITPGSVAELYCLQNGFTKEKDESPAAARGEDAVAIFEELWDEHSEYIDDDIDSLSRWAGSTVVDKEQFKTIVAKLYELFKQQKEK